MGGIEQVDQVGRQRQQVDQIVQPAAVGQRLQLAGELRLRIVASRRGRRIEQGVALAGVGQAVVVRRVHSIPLATVQYRPRLNPCRSSPPSLVGGVGRTSWV